MPGPLLEVTDLSVRFETDEGSVHAVDRLSFTVAPGEVLGIVGESGCGKTVTCLSLVRLLPQTAVIGGTAVLDGGELRLHVGGGIVADSTAARELVETEEKAAGWRAALATLRSARSPS